MGGTLSSRSSHTNVKIIMVNYGKNPIESTSLTETSVGGVTGISAGAGTLAVSVTCDF